MNIGVSFVLLASLTSCATPSQPYPQTPAVFQSSPCHQQLVSQRLFMVIAGRGLQNCIDRPGYDTCMGAAATVERTETHFGIDHALFRSCFPEYVRTEREAFKETIIELNVFQKKLVKASGLFTKASKAGHF